MNINIRFKKSYFYIIYFLLSVLIFRNLLVDFRIWNYGDSFFPYSKAAIDNLFKQSYSAWYDYEFFGCYNVTYMGFIKIFFVTPIKILFIFVKDASIVQFVWYLLIFNISCISVYLLCKEITKNEHASFIAGLVYALSPWMVDRLAQHLLIYQAAGFIPLLFYFYYKFNQKYALKYAIYFSFITLFIIPSQHYTFISAFLIFSYFVHLLLFNNCLHDRIGQITGNLKLCLVTFFINSFFIVPFFLGDLTREKLALEKMSTHIYYYGRYQSLYNSLRLMGFHTSFYNFSNYFLSIIGFCLILYYTCSLLILEKDKKKYFLLYFWFILIFFIFATSFIKLLSQGNIQFLQTIPILRIFLSLPDPNYNLFGVVFSASLLFGFSHDFFMNKFKSFYLVRKTILIITSVIILLYALPILGKKDERYKQFVYPFEYDEMNNFFNNKKDGNILILPAVNSIRQSWKPYLTLSSLDLLSQPLPIIGPRTLEATPKYSYDLINVILTSIEEGANVTKILNLAEIKYILLHKDLLNDPPHFFFDKNKNLYYKKYLPNQHHITTKLINRRFNLYEVIL